MQKQNPIQHESNPLVELYHSSSAQEWDFKILLPPYPVQKRLVSKFSVTVLACSLRVQVSKLDRLPWTVSDRKKVKMRKDLNNLYVMC